MEMPCSIFFIRISIFFSLYPLFQISLSSEELANQILRDTQVLNTKENKKWDLDLIGYILKVRFICQC